MNNKLTVASVCVICGAEANGAPFCSECVTPNPLLSNPKLTGNILHTPAQAKAALICAHCKRGKLSGNAFCNSCYYALPRDLRRFLFRPINDGFEGAYTAALEWLAENLKGKE